MKRSAFSHARWWVRQWPHPQTSRGWRFFGLFQGCLIGVFVGVTIVLAARVGNFELVLFVVVFIAVVLIAFAVVPLMNLMGRRRSQILQQRFPEAIVVSAYLNDSLIEAVSRLTGTNWVPTGADMTTTIVFNGAGFNVWRGLQRPQQLVSFPWSAILRVKAREQAWRGVSFGEIELMLESEDPAITFYLLPKRILGISVPKKEALMPLVDRLENLRRDWCSEG